MPLASAIREANRTTPRVIQQRKKIAVLFAVLLVILSIVVWPFAKSNLQAVAVLRQVSGQEVPRILTRIVTEPVRAEDVQLPTSVGVVRARLYLPIQHPTAPGLMILHGVNHEGIDEARLMSFAAAMAGCGLQVLTPELPGIKDYRVDRDSVMVIGESAHWFAERTAAPVGVMGLSFSGGLALVAAANPQYRPWFRFVLAAGSHDEMEHVATYYLTSREPRPDGTFEDLPPHEYGALVMEFEHLEDFVPPQDESAVRAVLREHLYEDKSAEALAEAKLNAQQKAEAIRLMDSNSNATKMLLAASNQKHLQEMEQVSPHGILKTMTTPVYLLHGRADNIIPSAETMWIASELPSSTLKELLISPILSHLNMDGSKPGIWDQWQLVHLFAEVTRAAEGK